VCGLVIGAPRVAGESSGQHNTPASPGRAGSASCPRCGAAGMARFCEECGYSAATWTVVVMASRAHYDDVMAIAEPGARNIPFPAESADRTFSLTGDQVRIGRRSINKETTPEIDLTGPPTDPGISRLHAILLRQPDGSWAVVDPGSENGTTVNHADIGFDQPTLLRGGDSIRIGVWTEITMIAP
jgi:FHA domain